MSDASRDRVTAGVVVIGNEILSGKTVDANSPYLCRELTFLGVELRRIATVPDDAAMIGEAVKEFSAGFTWVFTSGGIGPTHDDITIPAIASAFGAAIIPEPRLEQAIRSHYAEGLTEDHLRMAQVPEGSELVDIPGRFFLQVRFRNIFIMPGVPELFRQRFEAIKYLFRGEPILLKELFLSADEGVIAATLRETAEKFPEVLIGSYPDYFHSGYRVKVTLEARQPEQLQAAYGQLSAGLRALGDIIVRES